MSSIDPTRWIKASKSSSNGDCIEMRQHDGIIQVRDTKDAGNGPVLGFTKAEFAAWLDGAKNGEFDGLAL